MDRHLKVKHCADVFLLNYPKHNDLKKEIVGYLETLIDVQNKQTNVKASMTDWNITSPEILNLKNYIVDFLNKKYFFVEERNQMFIFNDFWGNIYRENEFTIEHDHLFSIFSVVYFLKTNPRNDSPLVFSFSKIKITPNEGSFIIFPSYLKHKVPKQKSKNNVRITLSGNIDRI
jgi:hypothetical protein